MKLIQFLPAIAVLAPAGITAQVGSRGPPRPSSSRTSASFDPNFMKYLKDRLKKYIVTKGPEVTPGANMQAIQKVNMQNMSGNTMSSVITTVNSLKTILMDNEKKITELQTKLDEKDASSKEANSANQAKQQASEQALTNGLLAITKTLNSESKRIDEIFDLVDLNQGEIAVNFKEVANNKNVLNQFNTDLVTVQDDMLAMAIKLTEYIDANNVHLDNLINDFKNYMESTKPFYADFTEEVHENFEVINEKIQQLTEEAVEITSNSDADIGARSFGSTEEYEGSGQVDDQVSYYDVNVVDNSGSYEEYLVDQTADYGFFEDLDNIANQLASLGEFFG